MNAPMRMVCANCASENVTRDEWACWNVDTQNWELAGVFDDPHCHDCEQRTHLVEEDIRAAVEPAVEEGGHE